jgi:type IV pilus assembly protein PilX
MKPRWYLLRSKQQGMVLVSSLLLLVVVTIVAISMFRSFGIQEKIAGNVREKHRALQAAQTAEQYAENWLAKNATATSTVTCAAQLIDVNISSPQICSQATSLLQITGNGPVVAPWLAATVPVGMSYSPTGMSFTAGAVDSYAATPRFYITDLGASANAGQGEIYLINAMGFGGTADAIAVIESTFSVYTSSYDPSK